MTEQAQVTRVDLRWDLSDRLRKALRVSGLGVQDMAEELGVERNTVGRYINGHTRPSRATLVVWALRSGVPLEWLETGETEEGRTPSGDRPSEEYAIRDSNPEPADLSFARLGAQDDLLPAARLGEPRRVAHLTVHQGGRNGRTPISRVRGSDYGPFRLVPGRAS